METEKISTTEQVNKPTKNSEGKSSKELSSHEFTLFKAIGQFVTDLHSVFGERYKSLQLYNRLITKTTFNDIEPIRKHIGTFVNFVNMYQKQILSNRLQEIVKGAKVSYSERVYIDIQQIIQSSSDNQRTVIGQHLLNIYVLSHPKDEKAIKELESSVESTKKTSPLLANLTDEQKAFTSNLGLKSDTKEGKLISNLLTKTMNTIGGASDMPSALMSMLGSGLFTDMQKELGGSAESGEINPKKLMKEVKGFMDVILSKLSADDDDEDDKMPSSRIQEISDGKDEVSTPSKKIEISSQNLPIESVD